MRDGWLPAFLNSQLAWFFWRNLTPELRGGFARLKAQFIEQTPLPVPGDAQSKILRQASERATDLARQRFAIQTAVRRRILDLAPANRRKLNGRLEAWHELDFAAFRDEIKKAFHTEIPLKARGEWEGYLAENAEVVQALTRQIDLAEREIDAIVYGLFDLTADEVALIEGA